MKKAKKIFIGILIGLLLIWGSIFTTDFIRVSTFREPIFVIASETADDGGSGIYRGLGYKVKVEKFIDAEHGTVLSSVEMTVFGKVVAAAIT